MKDWIVKHQISAEAWYVANPNLTVAETRRLERVGKAVDEFLDKIGGYASAPPGRSVGLAVTVREAVPVRRLISVPHLPSQLCRTSRRSWSTT
jgi:hypothetical protein